MPASSLRKGDRDPVAEWRSIVDSPQAKPESEIRPEILSQIRAFDQTCAAFARIHGIIPRGTLLPELGPEAIKYLKPGLASIKTLFHHLSITPNLETKKKIVQKWLEAAHPEAFIKVSPREYLSIKADLAWQVKAITHPIVEVTALRRRGEDCPRLLAFCRPSLEQVKNDQHDEGEDAIGLLATSDKLAFTIADGAGQSYSSKTLARRLTRLLIANSGAAQDMKRTFADLGVFLNRLQEELQRTSQTTLAGFAPLVKEALQDKLREDGSQALAMYAEVKGNALRYVSRSDCGLTILREGKEVQVQVLGERSKVRRIQTLGHDSQTDEVKEIKLVLGDVVMVYSDGMYQNEYGQLPTEITAAVKNLLKVPAQVYGAALEKLTNAVAEVQRDTDEGGADDDVSLVVYVHR